MHTTRCDAPAPNGPHDRPENRRRVLGRAGLGIGAVVALLTGGRRAVAQDAPVCRINGVTGGGVVRTTTGDVTLALFASRFVEGDGQPAEGKVRWLDPAFAGGLALESVGAVLYEDVADEPRSREIRGVASVNGEFEAPFVLIVSDNYLEGSGDQPPDRCRIEAGNLIGAAGTPASGGWGYAAAGELIGGDLILLGGA